MIIKMVVVRDFFFLIYNIQFDVEMIVNLVKKWLLLAFQQLCILQDKIVIERGTVHTMYMIVIY